MPSGPRPAGWLAVGAVGLAALVLGYLGLDEHYARSSSPRSELDLLYASLQLFLFEGGSLVGPLPWKLEIARLLAPAVAGYAAFRALAAIFREQLDALKARRLRDHTVVCGASGEGAYLARTLKGRGQDVALLTLEPSAIRARACRAVGIPIVGGDARSPLSLTAAGVHRARYVVTACGSDGVNAEVAMRVRDLSRRSPRRALRCVAHIVEPRLCAFLAAQQFGRSAREPFQLEFFSPYRTAAQQLLNEQPPFGEGADAPQGDERVVLVGMGRFGTCVLEEITRRWARGRRASGGRLRVAVVDPEAEAKIASLRLRCPRIPPDCQLEAHSLSVESPEFQAGTFLGGPRGSAAPRVAYVCLREDWEALYAGLILHRHLARKGVPIVLRMATEGGLASLLPKEGARAGFEGLHGFVLLERACVPELVLGGAIETIARAMHRRYVRERARRGETAETNEAAVAWEELPDALRESNRDQAVDVGRKLRSVGCELAPLTDWDADRFEFSPEEVEKLARAEHDRWLRERRGAGWQRSRGRDVGEGKSPHIVPWDELPEEIRDYDRDFIRGLPGFLAEAGFQILRVEEPGASRAGEG